MSGQTENKIRVSKSFFVVIDDSDVDFITRVARLTIVDGLMGFVVDNDVKRSPEKHLDRETNCEE